MTTSKVRRKPPCDIVSRSSRTIRTSQTMFEMNMDFKGEIAKVLGIDFMDVFPGASFVELGGNSISAVALENACRRLGFHTTVETILTAPDLSKLWKQAAPRRRSTRKTVNLITHESFDHEQTVPSSMHGTHPKAFESPLDSTSTLSNDFGGALFHNDSPATIPSPITQMQLSFIHGGQRRQGTNVIHYYETYSVDQLSAMKRAWRIALESEPVFRTEFNLEKETGIMTERDGFLFKWSEIAVATQDLFDAEVAALHLSSDVTTSFKVVILQSKEYNPKCTIIWRVHHSLIDGHSFSILIKKVRRIAAGLPILPGLSFVSLARKVDAFRRTWRTTAQDFWSRQHLEFGAGNAVLSLPQGDNNSACVTCLPSIITAYLPRDKLCEFAQSVGVTEATLYYAAWMLVLSQFMGSDLVTMGVVFSGRSLPIAGMNETVGSMVNTLPFHVRLDRKSSVLQYIRDIFRRLAELSTFQWSTPEDGYSQNYSTVMSIFVGVCEGWPQEDDIAPLERPYSKLLTDIPISINGSGDETMTFASSGVYNESDIARMVDMYQKCLLSIMDPSHSVDTCLKSLISSNQLHELLYLGNCLSSSTSAASVTGDLVTLFDKCVQSYPTAVAVEKGAETVSYAQLNHSALLVAWYLKSEIGAGEVVCVHADRSINWIVAIYGILKANAVYCPIDSTLPSDLRKSYLDISNCALFLTATKSQALQFYVLGIRVVSIEEILHASKLSSRDRPVKFLRYDSQACSENAYLCFTSGSSGKPKGVLCTHKGLVAFQRSLEVRLFAGPGKRIAQFMSPAFDGSIHETFSTLSYGGTLVLSNSADPFEHLTMVDSAMLTPSIARILCPTDYPRLKTVYLVGEAVPQGVNDTWAAAKDLYNMYGPTEGTCGATIKRLKAGQSVTIGNPNPSSRIYILDSCQRMLPRGVIGEIYLAGVQISNGYIGRPRETATCFMTDSIFPDLEERMYRTGDRGYWNADGELVYLGRNDRRIKLRGFRLDLDDIETRILETILSASTIAVTAVGETIVAMLEPSSLDLALVRSLLGKALPPYAIPQRLAAVEKIPLTPTGKIDYKAIEKFAFPPRMPVNEQYMTQSEQTVASIWRSILNLSIDVKVHGMSSFLDLGGNSIQILLLSHRLSAQFGRPVSMKMVLESNTLADLARAIETIHLTEKICTETQKSILGAHNLSSIEYEWWLKYDLGRGSSCFNVSYACSFTDAVERSRLALAWNTILARHEILRGKFVGNKKDGVKREYTNHPPRVQRLRRIDFRKEVNTPFILHRQHPIRVLMSSKELLVIVSHIICDMTTIKILLKEVGLVYLGGTLEPVGKKYGDTIGWNFKLPSTTLEFWSKYLEDLPSLKYDVGKCSLQRKGYGGSSLAYIVPPAISRTMAKFSAASKISLHQLSLAAVSLALTYTSEQQDVILGAPFLNRTSSDDLETVGLFLEPLPVRIQYPCRNSTLLSDNSQLSIDVDPFLLEIRSSSRAALAHEIPWNRLCEHLNIEPEYPNHPIFDVMVTFHEYETKPLLQLPHLTPLYTWAEGAKFKLMVEFQAISQDCLILRLEHDEDCFSMEDIEVFQKLVMLALDLLASGRRHEEVKKHLLKLAVSLPRPHAVKDSQNLFAMPIESLK